MAKTKNVIVGSSSNKNHMVKVKCPSRGDASVFANSSKKGYVCVACGQTGHDLDKTK